MLFDRPRPLTPLNFRTVLIAVAIHCGMFAAFWVFAACHGLFEDRETIIPIDLTVVVNENLEGEEAEPPPLKKPERTKVEPPKELEKPKEQVKPKELERIVTNVVARVDKPREQEKRKPAMPKKTKEQLRQERLAAMRNSAKVVNTPVKIEVPNAPKSGNGKTDRKTLTDAEIRARLNQGYKPGASTQLSESDLQLGLSLIKTAIEEKWEMPPWTDTLKSMTIRIWFDRGGRIVNYKMEESSGDARADQSIRSAASRVGRVVGIPAAFYDKYGQRGVSVRFTVKPQ